MKDKIIDYLYDVIIINRHKYLTSFYYAYFEFVDPHSLKWEDTDIIHKTSKSNVQVKEILFFQEDKYFERALDADKTVISMQKNDASRRLVRNLNYLEILDTTKITNTQKSKTSFWKSLTDVYNKLTLADRMFAPSSLDQFFEDKNLSKELNYNAFFYLFQGYQPKASILNPYTVNWIINHYFTNSENKNTEKSLFTPVLSWCSYILAFMHTDKYWKHYVGIDVIPDVVERTKFVHSLYKTEKTIDVYCKESELFNNDPIFLQKYTEYFDAIIMCPPYFNMEIYKEGNQSISKYPIYEEWLEKYWEQTVEMCKKVTKIGGKFSFIANNYCTLEKVHYDLISDLNKIAMKYFKLIDILQLHNRGSPLRMNHKDRTEMLFIYENSPQNPQNPQKIKISLKKKQLKI